MRLRDGVSEAHQRRAVPGVFRQVVHHLGDGRVQGLLNEAAEGPLGQAVYRWVYGYQAACMDQLLLALQQLILGGLKDEAAPEDVDLSAYDQGRSWSEGLGQVGLIEPDGPNVAGVVAQDRLGRSSSGPLAGLGRLPDGDDHRLLLAVLQIGYFADIGEVVVPVGK